MIKEDKYNGISTATAEHDIVISRILDAPREIVWKYWTEPEAMKKWWGPKGFTLPVNKLDFHVGGEFNYCMRSPENKDYCGKGEYLDIVPNELLVMSDHFSDENGNIVPASYYGMSGEGWPLEMRIKVTFEDEGGKTKLVLKHSGFPDKENACMADEGWSQSFDKLEEELLSL